MISVLKLSSLSRVPINWINCKKSSYDFKFALEAELKNNLKSSLSFSDWMNVIKSKISIFDSLVLLSISFKSRILFADVNFRCSFRYVCIFHYQVFQIFQIHLLDYLL